MFNQDKNSAFTAYSRVNSKRAKTQSRRSPTRQLKSDYRALEKNSPLGRNSAQDIAKLLLLRQLEQTGSASDKKFVNKKLNQFVGYYNLIGQEELLAQLFTAWRDHEQCQALLDSFGGVFFQAITQDFAQLQQKFNQELSVLEDNIKQTVSAINSQRTELGHEQLNENGKKRKFAAIKQEINSIIKHIAEVEERINSHIERCEILLRQCQEINANYQHYVPILQFLHTLAQPNQFDQSKFVNFLQILTRHIEHLTLVRNQEINKLDKLANVKTLVSSMRLTRDWVKKNRYALEALALEQQILTVDNFCAVIELLWQLNNRKAEITVQLADLANERQNLRFLPKDSQVFVGISELAETQQQLMRTITDLVASNLKERQTRYLTDDKFRQAVQEKMVEQPEIMSWAHQYFIGTLVTSTEQFALLEEIPRPEETLLTKAINIVDELTTKKNQLLALEQESVSTVETTLQQLHTLFKIEQTAKGLVPLLELIDVLAQAQQDLMQCQHGLEFNKNKINACLNQRLNSLRQVAAKLKNLADFAQKKQESLIENCQKQQAEYYCNFIDRLKAPENTLLLAKHQDKLALIVFDRFHQIYLQTLRKVEDLLPALSENIGLNFAALAQTVKITNVSSEILREWGRLITRAVELEKLADNLNAAVAACENMRMLNWHCKQDFGFRDWLDDMALTALQQQQAALAKKLQEISQELLNFVNTLAELQQQEATFGLQLRAHLADSKNYAVLYWYDQKFAQDALNKRFEQVQQVYAARVAHQESSGILSNINTLYTNLLTQNQQFLARITAAEEQIKFARQIAVYHLAKIKILYNREQQLQENSFADLLQLLTQLRQDYCLDMMAIQLLVTNPIEQEIVLTTVNYWNLDAQLQAVIDRIKGFKQDIAENITAAIAEFNNLEQITQQQLHDLLNQDEDTLFKAWCYQQLTDYHSAKSAIGL